MTEKESFPRKVIDDLLKGVPKTKDSNKASSSSEEHPLHSKIQDINELLKHLKDRQEQTREALLQIKFLNEKMERLEKEYNKVNPEQFEKKLDKKIKEADIKDVSELEEKIEKISQKFENQKKQLEDILKIYPVLRKKLVETISKVEKLESEIGSKEMAELHKNVRELEEGVHSFKKLHEESEVAIGKTLSQLKTVYIQVKKNSERIENISKGLGEGIKTTAEKLRSKIENFNESKNTLQETILRLNEKVEKTENERKRLEKKFDRLSEHADKISEQFSKSVNLTVNVRDKIEESENKAEEAIQISKGASLDISELKKKHQDVEKELDEMKRSSEELHELVAGEIKSLKEMAGLLSEIDESGVLKRMVRAENRLSDMDERLTQIQESIQKTEEFNQELETLKENIKKSTSEKLETLLMKWEEVKTSFEAFKAEQKEKYKSFLTKDELKESEALSVLVERLSELEGKIDEEGQLREKFITHISDQREGLLEIERKFKALKEEIPESEEIQKNSERLNTLSDALERERQYIQEAVSGLEKERNSEKEYISQEIESVKKDILEIVNLKTEELRKTVEVLEKKYGEELSSEVGSLEERLKEIESNESILKSRELFTAVSEISKRLSGAESLSGKISDIKDSLESLDSVQSEMGDAVKENRSRLREIIQSEKTELREKLDEVDLTLSSLRERTERLEASSEIMAEMPKIKTHISELDSITQKILQQTSGKNEIETALSGMKASIAENMRKINSIKNSAPELGDIEERIESVNKEVKILRETRDILSSRLNKTDEKYASIREELSGVSDYLRSMEEELSKSISEVRKGADKKELMNELSNQTELFRANREKIDSLRADLLMLEKKIKERPEEAEILNERLIRLEGEIEAVKSQNLTSKISSVKKELGNIASGVLENEEKIKEFGEVLQKNEEGVSHLEELMKLAAENSERVLKARKEMKGIEETLGELDIEKVETKMDKIKERTEKSEKMFKKKSKELEKIVLDTKGIMKRQDQIEKSMATLTGLPFEMETLTEYIATAKAPIKRIEETERKMIELRQELQKIKEKTENVPTMSQFEAMFSMVEDLSRMMKAKLIQ